MCPLNPGTSTNHRIDLVCTEVLMQRKVQSWMLKPRISGIAAGVVRFLISKFLTLIYACHPPTARRHQLLVIAGTNKKRDIYNIMYKKRINNVEHVSFTPIVLSSTGGLGPITMAFNPVSFLRSLLTSPTAGP